MIARPPFHFDWPVRAGNNLPRLFRVPEGEGGWADLTGARMRVWIKWPGGEIALDSATPEMIGGLLHGIWVEDQSDPDWRGFFGVRLSLAQSRLLPAALEPARYEIERWIDGEQSTDFFGRVLVLTGENADA